MSGTREMSASDKPAVSKSDAEWRGQLSREEYAVLRMQHTEARWKGYTNSKDEGTCLAGLYWLWLLEASRKIALSLPHSSRPNPLPFPLPVPLP